MIRKILFFIGGFLIFCSPALAEDISLCPYNYLQAFDKADEQLLESLEKLTQQNNQNTSQLTTALPQIIRSHRCHLYWICTAAENAEKEKSTMLNIFGCEITTIGAIESKFSTSLEQCAIEKNTTTIEDMQSLRQNCFLYADFKIEQLKITIPYLLRKDANRKEMAFLAFKLYDLNKRLKELQDDASDLLSRFNKIMFNIKCIVDKCS